MIQGESIQPANQEQVDHILKMSASAFSRRGPIMTLWQEQAENFYPERADFTVARYIGEDFARNLITSAPVIVRRELSDALGQLARPSQTDWFQGMARYADTDSDLDQEARRWLERMTRIQKRAMYDPDANFLRATKEGDNDYVTFGQTVIQIRMFWDKLHLLYKCHHLRDVAWLENYQGKIDTVFRKCPLPAIELCRMFGKNVHPRLKEIKEKDPFREIECLHIELPEDLYNITQEGYHKKQKFVSLYIDVANKHVMEQVPVARISYVIPRWETVSGSQYAYSPATVAALPDARLIQAMTLVLLESGQKAVDPPMIATLEALRGDIQIYSGGITYVDAEYDERLGEALRPINQDRSGLQAGFQMQEKVLEAIQKAFYLDKINLPPMADRTSAYEISERVKEYVRAALPLFEPMETEYNGGICNLTCEILFDAGAFGPIDQLPDSLSGKAVDFRFESPLREAAERKRSSQFLEAKALIAEALAIDPTAPRIINPTIALRDALTGSGVPATWIRSQAEMDEIAAQDAEAQQGAQLLATMSQGAQVAEQVGQASIALNEAQKTAPA